MYLKHSFGLLNFDVRIVYTRRPTRVVSEQKNGEDISHRSGRTT